MKSRLILIIPLLFIIPLLSANLIPSERTVFVENHITNVEQFPDYEFILSVQYAERQSTILIGMDENTSLIPLWSIGGSPLFGSVYALKKSDSPYDWKENKSLNIQKIFNLDEIGAKKVISDLELFRTTNIGVKSITAYYNIDLDLTKNKPDEINITSIQKDFLYISIPIVALIIFLIIFIKRKKKK
jgi:hypothetical protein